MNASLSCLLTAGFLSTLAATGHAQMITFDDPVDYTGSASQLATNGSYVDALETHGNNDVAVDVTNPSTGVVVPFNIYSSVVSPSSGLATFSDNTFSILAQGDGGSDGSNSTATAYQQALDGSTYIFTPGIGTITMSGLTSGDEYQIQIFNVNGGRPTTYTSGTNSVIVGGAVTGAGPGQYVIGTFTANSATDSFTFQNTPGSTIDVAAGEVNGLSLRDLSDVPEPSTYAMMLAALALLGVVIRRKTVSFRA
jgi:hypothetical protein